MKNQYLCLIALAIISSCSNHPEKVPSATVPVNTLAAKPASLARTYYPRLDINQCMTVLFKDFDADSARSMVRTSRIDAPADEPREYEEQTTGRIDTTWFWKPAKEEEIRQRYQGVNPARFSGHRVEYGITDYCRLDSVIALLYYVGNDPYPSNIGEGLAIFRKNRKGWFLSQNDYNFYRHVAPGKSIKRFEDAGQVNGQPALLFLCESQDRYAPLSRQLLLVNYNLSLLTPPATARLEVKSHSAMVNEAFVQNAGQSMSVNQFATEAIATNRELGPDYSVRFVLNRDGEVVGLNYYSIAATEKGAAATPRLLLSGSIIENSDRFREGTEGQYAYAPGYRLVGMWKDYAGGRSAFFTGTQFHTYAEGSLADSSKVRATGLEKLVARQRINQAEANDAAEFNRNANQEFQRMRAEQVQNQAVDKVIRDLGLCSYCSGKGCLQCNNTGRMRGRQ